jgi:hypothetical protein
MLIGTGTSSLFVTAVLGNSARTRSSQHISGSSNESAAPAKQQYQWPPAMAIGGGGCGNCIRRYDGGRHLYPYQEEQHQEKAELRVYILK